jgi:hypothetical protein
VEKLKNDDDELLSNPKRNDHLLAESRKLGRENK